MFTIYNILPAIFNLAFVGFKLYNDLIVPLKNEINEMKVKQDMLYEEIIKLKNIINADKTTIDENKHHIKNIENEVDNMYIAYGKRIDKIEEEVFKSETNTSEDEDEDDEDEDEDEESYKEAVTPLQNHVKFPHFTLYNASNYQKSKKNSHGFSCKYLKDQIRLISYGLAQFLNVEPGTCMTVEEVYNKMMNYISANCSRNKKTKVIEMDSKLRQLFAINENEDYELKSSNLILYLKPHLKVIV